MNSLGEIFPSWNDQQAWTSASPFKYLFACNLYRLTLPMGFQRSSVASERRYFTLLLCFILQRIRNSNRLNQA